jgi:type II secretory pathway pseudopilin PulG
MVSMGVTKIVNWAKKWNETMELNSPKLSPQSTWLEVAIGIVLLLVLITAVVPRFCRAAGEGRLATLSDTLHLVRSSIDVYRAEHHGLLPGQRKAGQAVSPKAFIEDITCLDKSGQRRYFEQFPANPFISDDECRSTVTCVRDPNTQPDGTEGTAWWFNSATGEFKACDDKFHTTY